MSPRGAWRLVTLGFTDVYDYVASKVDWIGAGLPFEGTRATGNVATLADPGVPTCRMDEGVEVRARVGEWDICLVVKDRDVVLGLVRAEVLDLEAGRAAREAMQEAPRTYRPHMTPAELLPAVQRAAQPWVLVTNLDGTLVGVARPDQVHAAAHAAGQEDHDHG